MKKDDFVELKIAPEYMQAQLDGIKNFEIRRNDKNFHVGQLLWLCEWAGGRYTGRKVTLEITFITDFHQQPGYVVLGTRRAFK